MRSTIATYLSIRGLFASMLAALVLSFPAIAGQGLIYSVQRDGGPRSYLVGTMHSEDERVTALIRHFTPLIEEVEVLAVEMVPDAVTLLAVGAATLLPAGSESARTGRGRSVSRPERGGIGPRVVAGCPEQAKTLGGCGDPGDARIQDRALSRYGDLPASAATAKADRRP